MPEGINQFSGNKAQIRSGGGGRKYGSAPVCQMMVVQGRCMGGTRWDSVGLGGTGGEHLAMKRVIGRFKGEVEKFSEVKKGKGKG